MIRGLPHPKNWEAIQRMTARCNIEFEYTNSIERLKRDDYEILYCICSYVDYNLVPPSVKIIYGPQFWVVPEPPIVGTLKHELIERCVFNSLSNWVMDFYLEMAGSFIMPITQFPFSVNLQKFSPQNKTKILDCIVYIKRRSKKIIDSILSILTEKKISYKVYKYGNYNEKDYLCDLQQCKFMICLDAHESQGFALEEAMSCGVPLLVMDATSMYDEMDDGINPSYAHLKPKNLYATSVPYISEKCGIKISTITEFESALHMMLENYTSFNPREYIEATLSDEVCMKRILDYFKLT
jgi:glycosyltransferase involved in cell wall biosynthesis